MSLPYVIDGTTKEKLRLDTRFIPVKIMVTLNVNMDYAYTKVGDFNFASGGGLFDMYDEAGQIANYIKNTYGSGQKYKVLGFVGVNNWPSSISSNVYLDTYNRPAYQFQYVGTGTPTSITITAYALCVLM